MRFLFCITVLIAGSIHLGAQTRLIKTFDIPESGVTAVDYIGNFYVQNNNELWMINRNDTLFRKFSIINLADISSIDATNALKILLYYEDLGRILFIDNNISDFSTSISLNEFDLAQSTLVCSSYDNGFWAYLPNTMSLYRYDQFLSRTTEVESINRFVKLGIMEPVFMKEYSNQLFMYFSGYGWLVFDVFGAYVQTIFMQDCLYPDIQSGELIHYRNDSLFFQSLNNINDKKVMILPHHDEIQSVRYSSGKAYILANNKLFIYKQGG